MIQLILALLLGFQTIPQPGGFDVLIQFRLSEPPRTDKMCEAPLGFGFETVLETVSTGNVNVRALPTTTTARVASVKAGDVVNIFPAIRSTEAVSGNYLWYPVQAEDSSWYGFVAGALIVPPEFVWGC